MRKTKNVIADWSDQIGKPILLLEPAFRADVSVRLSDVLAV